MFCDRCGTQLPQSAAFCAGCGKAVGFTPLVPAQGRITGHVHLLGIFWLAMSAVHLIPGLLMVSLFGHRGRFLPPEVPTFVHGIVSTVGVFILAAAVAGLITGWGLLQREPWGRMLAIVMACLNLINIPFGTALGIYTLWVLLPAQSEQEYRNVARAA